MYGVVLGPPVILEISRRTTIVLKAMIPQTRTPNLIILEVAVPEVVILEAVIPEVNITQRQVLVVLLFSRAKI